MKADGQQKAQRRARADHRCHVRSVHFLEARIVDLERRPSNRGRRRLVTMLRQRLDGLRATGPLHTAAAWYLWD